MQGVMNLAESIRLFFTDMFKTLEGITVIDVIDILCLSVVLYFVFKFIMERRAGKLALGVVVLVLMQLVCDILKLRALQFVLTNVFQLGVLTLVILFQPELRSALEKVGSEPIRGIKNISEQKNNAPVAAMIAQVCEAAENLSDNRVGALIVFERSTKLGDRILTGTVINAEANAALIRNIFYDKAPLHDGAVIIRNNRLYAAGCLLPLSENLDIIKDLGTRHRAAIGLSENSDAIVLVVSEETGIISIAHEGRLERGFTRARLNQTLLGYLDPSSSKPKKRIGKQSKEKESDT